MLERASDFSIEDDDDEVEMKVVSCVNRIAKNGLKLVSLVSSPLSFSFPLVLVPSHSFLICYDQPVLLAYDYCPSSWSKPTSAFLSFRCFISF
jgi:hypothetical protein